MPRTSRKCRACGAEMKLVRKDYLFKESGLDNVLLKDIEILVCGRCASEAPRVPRLNDLIRHIAVDMVAKPSELSGLELRFLSDAWNAVPPGLGISGLPHSPR